MEKIDFYINIVISLMGVAYPLLLQVIARLDEKYSSENIVELFDKELEGKAFKYLLYSSLIFIVLWSLNIKPLVKIEGLNFLINNSSSILVSLNTVFLMIAFFFFVRKILIYYTPSRFIQYLKKKHLKSKDTFRFFEALSDLLLLSIKMQQRNLSLTLSEFFYTAFRMEREKSKNEPVFYPDLYYEIVHKAIEELAILKEKRNYSLEYRTAGGIWLLGEFHSSEISEKTYAWMWKNLLLVTQYEQEDMIVYHWETAHQYFTFSLQQIHNDDDYSHGNLQVRNKREVEKKILEREKFIEFQYALGGLLLYKQMYGSIKRLFSYTNSQPPKFELLPESMNEIFNFYFTIRNPYDRKYIWISNIYPFPKQSGLYADSIIKKWISSYMTLLFLRQYTINPYLVTMKPLDYPPIPKTQGEIKEWIDGLDFFKELIQEHLDNSNLHRELNLSHITMDCCIEKNKVFPIDFIDNFKIQLLDEYHNNALSLQLHLDKIKVLENSTKYIIENTLTELSLVSNSINIDDKSDKWYFNGQRMLQSKDAFSENPEVHHIDYDSVLATSLSKNIKEGVLSTFLFKKSKSYLLKPVDIFNAIESLNIDEQFIIVCFGVNLDYFIGDLKIQSLEKGKYKNIIIVQFESSRLVKSSFFILKRKDLPQITTKEISPEIISKYSLSKISDYIELYISVIDLNSTSQEIIEENRQEKEDEDEVRKSVLISIMISAEIKWKKGIEMIHIIQHTEYSQNGLPNNISELQPFIREKPSR
jgi:hypothetical protein